MVRCRLVRVHPVRHVCRRVAHAERVERPLAVGVVHAARHAVHAAAEVTEPVLLLWEQQSGVSGRPALLTRRLTLGG